MEKPKAIVLDVDGVCLDSSAIIRELFELKLKGDAKWDYFREHCNGDKVKTIESTREFMANVCYFNIYIILLTARNEKCREATEKRLREDNFIFDELYMRPQNDYSPAPEIKRNHLLKLMESYDIIAFVDDDLANCEMAKELGILALRKV